MAAGRRHVSPAVGQPADSCIRAPPAGPFRFSGALLQQPASRVPLSGAHRVLGVATNSLSAPMCHFWRACRQAGGRGRSLHPPLALANGKGARGAEGGPTRQARG